MPLCRDSQANEMQQLISLHVDNKQGGSIYVSGVPGTGTVVSFILQSESYTEEGLTLVSVAHAHFLSQLQEDVRLLSLNMKGRCSRGVSKQGSLLVAVSQYYVSRKSNCRQVFDSA